MPKLECICGNIFNLSEIPTEDEYIYFSSNDWEEALKALADIMTNNDEDNKVILIEKINDVFITFLNYFYVCPRCGRLNISQEDSDVHKFYSPETQ